MLEWRREGRQAWEALSKGSQRAVETWYLGKHTSFLSRADGRHCPSRTHHILDKVSVDCELGILPWYIRSHLDRSWIYSIHKHSIAILSTMHHHITSPLLLRPHNLQIPSLLHRYPNKTIPYHYPRSRSQILPPFILLSQYHRRYCLSTTLHRNYPRPPDNWSFIHDGTRVIDSGRW